MGEFDVLQRTMDGMFNATALLAQWNAVGGNRRKQMKDFLNTKPTQEFVIALRERLFEKSDEAKRMYPHLSISDLVPSVPMMVPSDQVVQIKKNGQITSQGRVADEVWMHPLLFIKFACWINPRFEVRVLEFVQDQLILYRNRIADSHRRWTDMLQKLGCRDRQYAAVQRDLNLAVFGESYEGIRDHATEEQLLRMRELENSVAEAVEFGLLKNMVDVGSYLRKVYDRDFPNPRQ